MADANAYDYDFFISRRGAQADVAQEVAQALIDDGWPEERIFLQDKDLAPGLAILNEIEKAVGRSRHFIAVLCSTYADSHYTNVVEAQTFLHNTDVGTQDRRLIVIKVEPVETPSLLRNFGAVDLHGIDDTATRRTIILNAAHGRTVMTQTAAPIFHGVPDRLDHFTGRDNLLINLQNDLLGASHDAGGAVAVTQALAGMGGVGKTILAAEYAHRHRSTYAGIWWAPAETRAVLEASLAELAGRLDPKLAEEADQVALAKTALEQVQQRAGLAPWLLIYDNVEAPKEIEGLRPTGGAHLIVTTRFQAWPGARADVGLFSRDVSIAFLQERAEFDDEDGASRLAEQLDDLPLALDHAAAYCLETGVTFDEYIAHLYAFIEKKPESSVYRRHREGEETVSGTFSVALARATEKTPHTERLMDLLSALGAEPVPLDLLGRDWMTVPERAEAVGALGRFSLLQQTRTSDDRPAVMVHRLVARVSRANAADNERFEDAISQATALLAEHFPDEAYREPAQWPRCAALLPHVLALRARWSSTMASAKTVRLLYCTGGYLYGRATFADAEPMFRDALAIGKKILGPYNQDVSICLSYLAGLLRSTGRHKEAEPLFREAIEISEKTRGREHPNVATDLNNLATLLREIGQTDEAEALYLEAIEIDEKAYGRNHTEVAIDLCNLANLLRDTGRTGKAEALYREAIKIDETAYGRDHPTVATALNNLAKLLRLTGRAEEAEPLFRESLATYEVRLGVEHPWVNIAAVNLARLLDKLNRGAEAAELRTHYRLYAPTDE